MKKFTIFNLALVSVVMSIISATSPNAEIYTPRIDARQAKQQKRIQQGVNSGQISPGEAARLNAQQDRIERLEDWVEADGVLSGKERARLAHRQNKASRNIHRKKHNRWR